MKNFLAIYVGTQQALGKWKELAETERTKRQEEGKNAWMDWGREHAAAIVERGSPLGKTKRISPEGTGDIKNVMTGYVIVRAESHEAAARMFENHPHFTIFPGDSVEIMECLPMPM